MTTWRRVLSVVDQKPLYSVGILYGGKLWNPNGYPEDIVRASVLAAEEQKRQRIAANRRRGAQQAAKTRAQRHDTKLQDVAKQMLRDEKIGPADWCVLCGKPLSDPESIARGIGSECWQHVLQAIEKERTNDRQA